MKTFLAILFLLATAFSYAEPPSGKTGTVTVTYTGSDGKPVEITMPNLDDMEVTLPLYISDTRHWIAHISFNGDKPLTQLNLNLEDLAAQYPPHGDTIASPVSILNSTFEFESGKPVVVLKSPDYSITVTVTLPTEKK